MAKSKIKLSDLDPVVIILVICGVALLWCADRVGFRGCPHTCALEPHNALNLNDQQIMRDTAPLQVLEPRRRRQRQVMPLFRSAHRSHVVCVPFVPPH